MADKKTREEKMSEIRLKLENGVRDIFESDRYKEYIQTMSKFPHYSINNCILIASQKPDATYVCGFKKWQEFGRAVNKGSHGIMIIAPVKVKGSEKEQVLDENSKPVIGADGQPVMEEVTREYQSFRPAYVFDYADTSGDPLPSITSMLEESVESFEELKEVLIKVSPVPITFEPITTGANGFYSPTELRIVVKDDLPQLQTIKTMIHEIGHASLGHGSKEDKWDRETKEVQAESVAYWVTQMLGLDTSDYSFGYIGGWSKDKEVSELKESLDIIKTTADEISKKIEDALSENRVKEEAETVSVPHRAKSR